MAIAAGCGGGKDTPTDTDASPPDAATEEPACASASDCDDGVFCNGEEQCMPGAGDADERGCVAATTAACMPDQICEEDSDECLTECGVNPDADGDGHDALDCGGDDCDDADGDRFPGNPEVCDADGHDEDCDPSSLGSDEDGDGYPSVDCCNEQADGSLLCGEDCDDESMEVNPEASEVCNGEDEDCDGMVDEGVLRTFYPDADGDGYGDDSAESVMGCVPPTDYVETGGDCNDADSEINPAAAEVCDPPPGVDENCDGEVNPASRCECTGTESRMCDLPGRCAAGTEMCSSGAWGDCSVAPATEICNDEDDDCDGEIDEGVTIDCYEDADDDTFAAAGATATPTCAVSGRAAWGGCPSTFTSRVPSDATTTDCDDTAAGVRPTGTEICDGALADEDCDGTANEGCDCVDAETQACPLPGVCAAGSQTCSSGTWSACSISPASELCNGEDDDCDGTTDEGVTITCYSDADDDGYATLGTTSEELCPVSGRAAVGGCPTTFTNREPVDATTSDCNDVEPGIHPGAVEQCDGAAIDEDCDGTGNEDCSCVVGETRACPDPGVCSDGIQDCVGGTWGACSISPSVEVCNSSDDDCDGTTDEGTTVTCYRDQDRDGYAASGATSTEFCLCPEGYTLLPPSGADVDCNDALATVFPGATESCNSRDDDCDGTIDEDVTVACYTDADGDDYAPAGATMTDRCSCTPTETTRAPGAGTTDCNDGNSSQNPATSETCNGVDDDCDGTVDEGLTITCYTDGDGDGFAPSGAAAAPRCGSCGPSETSTAPGSGTTDCDDGNGSVNPATSETCNGVDDNCNGTVDEGLTIACYTDADGDTYAPAGASAVDRCFCSGSMTSREPAGASSTDCNDFAASVNPGATESCNGADDDCDGSIDEGVTTTCYADGDGDGFAPAGASAIPRCGACGSGETSTAPSAGTTDCNDSNASVHPSATETCNGVDDNCDGSVDEGVTTTCYGDGDGDSYAPAGASPLMLCSCSGATTSREPVGPSSTDCDDTEVTVNPGASETCNAIDDDCDGSVDEGTTITCYADADGDGFAPAGASSADRCSCLADETSRAPTSAANTDCDDSNASVHPSATETCNGIDDNCDGAIDPGLTIACYPDADGDSYAPSGATSTDRCSCGGSETSREPASASSTDCDDTSVSVNPGATESCNGVDDDCDGSVDEGTTITCYADADGDGFAPAGASPAPRCGSCGSGETSVAPGAGTTDCNDSNGSVNPSASETCNGIDDNCDGAIDPGLTIACYPDADGDSYAPSGAISTDRCSCGGSETSREPASASSTDCDDTSVSVNPGATESCNGVDDNCDGSIAPTEIDDDGDGMAECEGDCDDTEATVYDGAPEICDGLDNDCVGGVPSNETDSDSDGMSECEGDCNDSNPDIYAGAPELCDGLDNDCAGGVPSTEIDDDGDSWSECEGDCNDGDGSVFPGAPQLCDGINNDCNSVSWPTVPSNETDSDSDGYAECEGDCDDTNASTHPGAPEICDGEDNNCAGGIPATEIDNDGDGYAECEGDCNDTNATMYPGHAEICDGLDNDCSGGVPSTEIDNDGDGYAECEGDCNDGSPSIFPGASEIVGDEIDEDCNGGEMCYLDYDDDGYRSSSTRSSSDTDCRDYREARAVEATDCNDTNGGINPGATERCDDTDWDCNGVLRNGCPDSLNLGSVTYGTYFGGTGGSYFIQWCPTDEVLVGFYIYSDGTYVTGLQAACRRTLIVESASGTPYYDYYLEPWGGNDLGTLAGSGTGTLYWRRCNLDSRGYQRVVTEIHGHAGGLLDSFGFRCASIVWNPGSSGPPSAPYYATSETIGEVGGSGGTSFNWSCPFPDVGRGIRGRAGWDIDRISLICADVGYNPK